MQINNQQTKKELELLLAYALKTAKQNGATQAEASASIGNGFSVTTRMQELETVEHHIDHSFSISVYCGKKTGSASSSDFAKKNIQKAVKKACAIAHYTERDACAGLASIKSMAYGYPDLDLFHPTDFNISEAVQMSKECEAFALAYDKKIFNSEGATVAAAQNFGIYGNSHGFVGVVPTTIYSASCAVLARHKKEMQQDYDYTSARRIDHLASMQKIATTASERAIKRLGAKKIKTQSCPVIFAPECAKSLIGSFLGAISGGNLYRKASFLTDALGKKVFPTTINIDERPYLAGALGSAAFDADGVKTQDKFFVKNGVLQSYILSAYTARKMKMATTGNAGGVHNLFVSHSSYDLPALFKMIKRGLFVVELMGHGVNIVTGDYSRGIFGFWVENGVIQYPVSGVTIAGNLKQMFKNIVAVGSDVDGRGNVHTGSILIDDLVVAGN